MRFLIGTLPLLFLALWLYSNEVEAYSLGVLLFATPLFPYSLLYYSHVLVAVLIYMAFRLIYDSHRTLPEQCFKAGLLCGFALLCSFSSIVPLIIFGICTSFTESRDRTRRFLFYFAGVAPFIIILAVYNQLIFGSPFAFLSHYELSYSTFSSLYEFSVSPSHGLFFFSPILIFSLFAFFASEHGGTTRHFVKIATIVFTFIAVIGFAEKYGGESVGAINLIIIIPLMLDSFFDGEVEDYPSYFRGLLFAVSFLFCTIPMLTYSFSPMELQFPHNSFWQPLLFETNWFMPTILNAFGFANNIWTILPAILLLILAIYFVWRDAKFPLKFAIGLLAGTLVVGSYMFLLKVEVKSSKPFRKSIVQKKS